MKNPTLFLDRDGTINVDMIGAYVTKPSEFKLIPNVAIALNQAKQNGFKLSVITNQQGISKNLYSESDLDQIHKQMCKLIQNEINNPNFNFDDIQFCPHNKSENCLCRKPKTEMLKRSSQKLNSNLSKSFYIGDKDADLLCAHGFGIPFILVLTGYGKDTLRDIEQFPSKPIFVAKDLKDAVNFILKN